MANSTIPNLVAVSVPALTDLFGVRQSGDSRDKKLTVTQLLTLIPSAGDVSKVGTPVDNQIGVWTGDGTIEGDSNFRWDGSHLLLPQNNDAAAPTLSFGDGDTGLFESADDSLVISIGGTARWQFSGDNFIAIVGNGPRIVNEASTATNPTFLPALGDVSTGLGGVTGALDLIIGGVSGMHFRKAGAAIFIEAPDSVFEAKAGLPSGPTYSFKLDSNSGMYSGGAGTDSLLFSAGGVQALSMNELNSGVIQAHQANVAITAFATGGQANATQLDESYNVLSVVATTGDSVKLPPVFAIDSVMYIKNDGANAADIFPATGDDLGAGTNTAVSLAAGESASFIATVANATWTPWIVSVGGGGGDVTKVGTPVNNQIGIWTGDGTIEGDANFTWDGSHLLLPLNNDAVTPTLAFGDGDSGFYQGIDNFINVAIAGALAWQFSASLTSSTGNGPAMMGEGSTATNPTLVPVAGDSSTGIGGLPGNISLIVGGVERVHLDAALSTGNTFTGDWKAANGSGPIIQDEAASGTNPTLVPHQNDQDTGIGRSGVDELSLIAGGVQIAQAKEASGANQFIIAPGVVQDVPLTPSLAFGDGNTGFFESADNTLKVSVGNAARCFWQANNFYAENAAGWFLFNTAGTSSSSPIMGPNRGDNNTGIGHGADDQLDFICGGLNCITIREVGSARQIGFYNATPTSQQTGVAVTASAIHAALVTLGLITA